MADAYNVRTNGQRYYVYRLDGNVPVAEYLGDGAAAKAQREAAIRNQQHNERFGKKKESQPENGTSGDQAVGEVQTRPYPVPQQETPVPKIPKTGRPKKSETPNPPPGQGSSY
jgi:hypothetical protein